MDRTIEIAEAYRCKVIRTGRPLFYTPPGPSRNLALSITNADVLLHLDADMQLSSSDFLAKLLHHIDDEHQAVLLHEEDVAQGFWSRCKALERRCYWGTSMEAARAVTRALFEKVGGYDPEISSGEDFDITHRYRTETAVTAADDLTVLHHTGRMTLHQLLRKKFRYGRTAGRYLRKERSKGGDPAWNIAKTSLIAYLANIGFLVKDPIHYSCIFPLRGLELLSITLGRVAERCRPSMADLKGVGVSPKG